MPKVVILPHPEHCPKGAVVRAAPGTLLINAAARDGIEIEHACEKSGACTTCHVIVREGFSSLELASEEEEDMLSRAWGLEPESRLSCQTKIGTTDLVIEIPRYTINAAR